MPVRPLATAATLAVLAPGVAFSAHAAPRALECGTLTGKTVIRNAQVRLVDRPAGPTHRYYGCVPGSDGPVVRIAFGAGRKLTFPARNLGIVLAQGPGGAQTVWNLSSGAHYTVARAGSARLAPTRITPSGEAVTLFRGSGGALVVGFSARGVPVTLDSGVIPAGSLRLQGTDAHWTRGGARREGDLVTTRRTCKDLSGDPDDQYGGVTITQSAWPIPVFGASLDGTAFRYLACARPNGPVRQIATARATSLGGSDLRVARVAGHRVAFALAYTSSLGAVTDRQLSLTDLDEGTTALLWRSSQGHNAAFGTYQPGSAEASDAVYISPAGHVAAVFKTEQASQLALFQRDGQGYVIDSAAPGRIEPSSLQLTGSVLSWVNAGLPRSTELDNAPWPPRRLDPPTP